MGRTAAILLLLHLCSFLPAFSQSPDKTDWTKHEKFAECFAKVKASAEEVTEARKIIDDPPCFHQPFLKTLKEYLVISFFPNHYRNPLRECYLCQQIIAGAAQMHNFEHPIKLRRINDALVGDPKSPLIPEYLKHPFPRAEKECRYRSLGDLTGKSGLFILCTYHGSAQSSEELELLSTNPEKISDTKAH